MEIADYLIDQTGIDWAEVMADWAWLLPASYTLWMVNRFGDSILVMEDGTVHMLDIGAGTLKQLARDREAFCVDVDTGSNADYWLLISLVDKCVSAGLVLKPGQCYGFKLAPVFDGKYTVENTEVCDLEVNFSLLAQIHRQIRDLPDGAKVRLVVGP